MGVAEHLDLEELTRWRRSLHKHPEIAFEEHRTSEFVAEQLERFGLDVHRGLAQTGVVGTLHNGEGKSIGLRADLDALPMSELNTFEHRSEVKGCMHACGHDGHTTMLLGAAKYLSEHQEFQGSVHFIFQPAEEGLGGGRVMVEEGLFDKFPVDAVFGMHNWPGMDAGTFAVRPGAMMAASDTFEITVTGRGCHGAMPHMGVDPVMVGAQIVGALQNIVSRNIHPLSSAVVSVTQFHSGEAWAVVPESAVLRGTARSFEEPVRQQVEQRIGEVARGIAAAHGATVDITYTRHYPPTVNSYREAEFCAEVMESLVGADKVKRDPVPSMGAEDFSFMLEQRPGAYVWIGNGPGEGGCVLHNPHYDFNDAVIGLGVEYWVTLAQRFLAQTDSESSCASHKA